MEEDIEGGSSEALSDGASRASNELARPQQRAASEALKNPPSAVAGGGAAGGGDGSPIPIGVGFLDFSNATAALAPFGYTDPVTGDGRAAAQAVIDDINKEGGIGGRPIHPIYYAYDFASVLSQQGRLQSEQEMCALWTEDNHVFAMVPTIETEGVLLDCARKAGAAFIAVTLGGTVIHESRFRRELAHMYYRPNWMLAGRQERIYVRELHRMGFFERDARIGIMVHDRPGSKLAVERDLKPALAAIGVTPVAEIAFPDIVNSPWSTYVLQFQEQRVSHVLWGPGYSGVPVEMFMRASAQQQYKPRHAITSDHQPPNHTGATSTPDQVRGMLMVGWNMIGDIPEIRESYDNFSEGFSRCREIMRASGQAGTTQEEQIAYGLCDGFFLMEQALESAGEITLGTLQKGVEELGDGYAPVSTWAAHFGPGRHDGTSAVRNGAYDETCRCFRYTTDPIRAR